MDRLALGGCVSGCRVYSWGGSEGRLLGLRREQGEGGSDNMEYLGCLLCIEKATKRLIHWSIPYVSLLSAAIISTCLGKIKLVVF